MVRRELRLSCVVFWFILVNVLILLSLPFVSCRDFLFEPYWNKVDMSVSLPSDKHHDIQQLAQTLVIEPTCYGPTSYVLSGQDCLLCQWPCTTLPVVVCYSE